MSAADPGLQSEGPNPLEIFFEKNKKWIYTLVVILVSALGVKYGLEKLDRVKKNQQWSEFTAVHHHRAGGDGYGSIFETDL